MGPAKREAVGSPRTAGPGAKASAAGPRRLKGLVQDTKVPITRPSARKAGVARPVLDVGLVVGVGPPTTSCIKARHAAVPARRGAKAKPTIKDAPVLTPRPAPIITKKAKRHAALDVGQVRARVLEAITPSKAPLREPRPVNPSGVTTLVVPRDAPLLGLGLRPIRAITSRPVRAGKGAIRRVTPIMLAVRAVTLREVKAPPASPPKPVVQGPARAVEVTAEAPPCATEVDLLAVQGAKGAPATQDGAVADPARRAARKVVGIGAVERRTMAAALKREVAEGLARPGPLGKGRVAGGRKVMGAPPP